MRIASPCQWQDYVVERENIHIHKSFQILYTTKVAVITLLRPSVSSPRKTIPTPQSSVTWKIQQNTRLFIYQMFKNVSYVGLYMKGITTPGREDRQLVRPNNFIVC